MTDVESQVRSAARKFVPNRDAHQALFEVLRHAARRRHLRRIATAGVALSLAAAGFFFVASKFEGAPPGPAATAGTGVTAYVVTQSADGSTAVVSTDLGSMSTSSLITLKPSDPEVVYPDIALSPSGGELFLAYTAPDATEHLDVIDTSTGSVVDSQTVENLAATQVPTDYLAVAPDGKLFVYQTIRTDPGAFSNALLTYDPGQKAFLPQSVDLGACSAQASIFPTSATRLAILCGLTRELHIVDLSDSGGAASDVVVSLPPATRQDSVGVTDTIIAGGASPDGSTLYLVTQDGGLFTVDMNTDQLVGITGLPIPTDGYVSYRGFAVISGGSEALLATGVYGPEFDPFAATSVLRISLSTNTVVAQENLDGPATNFAPVGSGQALMLSLTHDAIVDVTVTAGSTSEQVVSLPAGHPIDIEARTSL